MAKQTGSSYKTEEKPDGQTRFIVTPASGGDKLGCTSWGLAIILAMFAGMIVGGAVGGMNAMFPAFIILIYPCYWGLKKYANKKSQGRRSQGAMLGGDFTVGSNGITINGTTIAIDKIHRAIMGNALDDPSQALKSAHVGGVQYALSMKTRSFFVAIESGGARTMLATGVEEPTAHGLLTDVKKILGLI